MLDWEFGFLQLLENLLAGEASFAIRMDIGEKLCN